MSSNFIHDLRSRSLGKYEILRSPSAGNSAPGPPGSLPSARNLEPELLLRKVGFCCNKIICLGDFFSPFS